MEGGRDERIELEDIQVDEVEKKRRERRGRDVASFLKYLPLLIAILIGGWILYDQFLGGGGGGKRDLAEIEAQATAIIKKGIIVPGPTLIVNLADRAVPRFLKISLVFEVDGPVTASEIIDKEPMIKDALISLLSSKTMQEVTGSENMQILKEEIVARINSIIHTGLVLNVYFTEFVVQ